MIYLIRLIRKSKIKDEEQIGAIHSKILLLFFSYLDKLCADVRNVEMKNKYFVYLKGSCKRLEAEISKIVPEVEKFETILR
jgi:hypothetical protein